MVYRTYPSSSSSSSSAAAQSQQPRRAGSSRGGTRAYARKRYVYGRPHERTSTPAAASQQQQQQQQQRSTARQRSSSSSSNSNQRSGSSAGAVKEPRTAPNWLAIKEIIELQESTYLLIPRQSFLRILRSIITDNFNRDIRISKDAVDALHSSTEDYLTEVMGTSYKASLHAKRVTLMPKDLALVRRVRSRMQGTPEM